MFLFQPASKIAAAHDGLFIHATGGLFRLFTAASGAATAFRALWHMATVQGLSDSEAMELHGL
jgi:hypothetical protein